MNTTPILDAITQRNHQNRIPFHMPTHYGGTDFFRISENLAALDTTELFDTDNLAHPTGCIRQTNIKLAKAFKSHTAHMLVNGSTGGIQAMLLYACKRGDTVILDSCVHHSLLNACITQGLNIEFLHRDILDGFGIAAPACEADIKAAMQHTPNAKAVLLTSPTYYGVCSDIRTIAYDVHSAGMLLIVDSAHGAHFAFSHIFPPTPIECGADLCVISLHKTLGALNQSAVLLGGGRIDENRLQTCINMTQTSSPSYILMGVMDYIVSEMTDIGGGKLDDSVDKLNMAKVQIERQTLCRCLSAVYAPCDPLRLVISFAAYNITGYGVAKRLSEGYNIDIEMADLSNAVCIVSHNTPYQHIDALVLAISQICDGLICGGIEHDGIDIDGPLRCPALVVQPYEAFFAPHKSVLLAHSAGCISAANVVSYPPGVAVIVCGSLITHDAAQHLQRIIDAGGEVMGIWEGKIDIVQG